MTTLQNAKQGLYYIVESLQFAQPNIARRLLDLGFVVGTKVCVLRKSITKRTLLVQLRGCCLSLRASVAKLVVVEDKND